MGMIFATTQLAARIEQAEARLSASIGRAFLMKEADVGAFVEEIGGGVALYTGPSSPMNKMIGVGFDAMPGDDQLRSLEDKFRSRDSVLQAEVSTLADPAFAAALSRRGYILQGFENVLGRAIATEDADGLAASDAIEVALGKDEEATQWLDVAITGFLHADEQGVQPEPLPPREALEQAFQHFTAVPGFRRYVARVDGIPAGVATLRFDDGLAQLCGAATLPAFRRRGVQTALLRGRLADAFHSGCELALMTTSPGSKSQENGHRQGFGLLYSRALLVKHPD